MVNLIINGKRISVAKGTTVMEAAEQAGIRIPHLCYLKGLNEIGACRVCVVEVQGIDKLITACNTPAEEGMEIYTNSPRVRRCRATNVKLILSDHDCKCATCSRSGNCSLQTISNDLGVLEVPYRQVEEFSQWDHHFPLIRDASKCIKCMRCIQICDKVQGLNVWDITGSGYRTTVNVAENRSIEEADCSLCGQCITHCPVGALRERNDLAEFFKALADPEVVTMVQVAPAVRTAWAEELARLQGVSCENDLAGAMEEMTCGHAPGVEDEMTCGAALEDENESTCGPAPGVEDEMTCIAVTQDTENDLTRATGSGTESELTCAVGGPASMGKLISALRQIGVDYVFDTNYAADLTIMEEGSEFLQRFADRDNYKWPMFTSCCPGWLRFVKSQYPDLIPNLSTAKSPQQMFGAMAKTYMAQRLGLDPDKIFCVSVMPCVSKKFECSVSQVDDAGHGKDVDLVLTTRELSRVIRADRIDFASLAEGDYDEIFGEGTGAAVIFGATGGVMEAALRSAYYLLTGDNPDADAFKDVRCRSVTGDVSEAGLASDVSCASGPDEVRGVSKVEGADVPGCVSGPEKCGEESMLECASDVSCASGPDGWREAVFEIQGASVKVAVVSGLGNARRLLEAIRSGAAAYDFVEVMACPGGCAGGGGQPIKDGEELAAGRGRILYGLDRTAPKRFSHENIAVQLTYKEFLGEPLSHRAHELLHTNLAEWEL